MENKTSAMNQRTEIIIWLFKWTVKKPIVFIYKNMKLKLLACMASWQYFTVKHKVTFRGKEIEVPLLHRKRNGIEQVKPYPQYMKKFKDVKN